MTSRLPLTEVSGGEIIARTVYQLILFDYHTNPLCYDKPADRLFDLSLQWKTDGFAIIGEEFDHAAIWCANNGTIAAWLTSRSSISLGRATRLAHTGRSGKR